MSPRLRRQLFSRDHQSRRQLIDQAVGLYRRFSVERWILVVTDPLLQNRALERPFWNACKEEFSPGCGKVLRLKMLANESQNKVRRFQPLPIGIAFQMNHDCERIEFAGEPAAKGPITQRMYKTKIRGGPGFDDDKGSSLPKDAPRLGQYLFQVFGQRC